MRLGRLWSACLALALALCSSRAQDKSEYTFGTTVVDSFGLQGRVYHLKPGTKMLPKFGHMRPVAWRARNLLELSVWSTYSAKNGDNARRVYEDAGRDVRGVYDAFIKWGTATAQAADWLDPLATA